MLNTMSNGQSKTVKSTVAKLRKSDVPVYFTTDYTIFKGVLGNRKVNERHAGRLTTSISKKNMLDRHPITVNEAMQIIDGQHRLQAAMTLQVPIYFMIEDADTGLEEVQQLNSYTKPWTSYDYLESYIALGKKPYIDFKEFIQQYQLSIEGGLVLIIGDNSSRAYRMFKNGDLKFTEKQWEHGERLANALWELKNYFHDAGYRRVYLYHALREVEKKGYLLKLVEKTKISNYKLQTQYSLRDYFRMFEDVLNWNNKSGELVRLF